MWNLSFRCGQWRHNGAVVGLILILIVGVATDVAVANDDPQIYTDVAAADGFGDFSELSLAELMDVSVGVSSSRARRLRDTPGVVTVVGKNEIRNSGARDLIDVLRLVPGFAFGMDVQGVVGVGFRGIWGHEGKVLVMINGMDANELIYSTFPFGMRFPVDQIERIEIIRGPGSVLYGGFAELAVINIVTEKTNLNGTRFSANYGQFEGPPGHGNLSIAFGDMIGKEEQIAFDISLFGGYANRAQGRFEDLYGGEYTLQKNNYSVPVQLQAGMGFGNWEIRYLHEQYINRERDLFDEVLDTAIQTDFIANLLSISYDAVINEKFELHPAFHFSRQQPWKSSSEEVKSDPFLATNAQFDGYSTRYKLVLDSIMRPAEKFDLLVGVAGYAEKDTAGTQDHYNETFYDVALYTEGALDTEYIDVFAGLRYEYHDIFKDALVPRLALTGRFGDGHAKFMASRAFRTPSLANFADNRGVNEIKPEFTTAFELELGYQVLESLYLGANAFNMRIDDPIVYFFDPVEGEGYENQDALGSRGVESELRFRKEGYDLTLTYSYYRVAKNNVENYEGVDGKTFLAFAPPKATVLARIPVMDKISVNPSMILYSQRDQIAELDADEEGIYSRDDPRALLNLFFRLKDLPVENAEIGFGVFNLLDTDFRFIQPYWDYHAPFPGRSREWVISFDYQIE